MRINHSRGTTSGGANGNTRLTTTVTNDNVTDQLFGNGELDWFWGHSCRSSRPGRR